MQQARSLLDSLLGGAHCLTRDPGAQGMAAQARGLWDAQSGPAKGAIAGGLLGVLLSGNARLMVGSGIRAGGAALIGSLAYRAYADWQAGREGSGAGTGAGVTPRALTARSFDPDDAVAERLLQAMVAAAKSDGHVTPQERRVIEVKLARMDLEAEAQALIAAELDSPLDAGRIAGLARNEAEAVEIYAASLLVVDAAGAAEAGYLAMLAARLGLEPDLVAQVHAHAGHRMQAPE